MNMYGEPKGYRSAFSIYQMQNISAVISSREATISKFNRIGLKAAFGSPRVRMIRAGKRYGHDPNRAEPEEFAVEVHGATGTWAIRPARDVVLGWLYRRIRNAYSLGLYKQFLT